MLVPQVIIELLLPLLRSDYLEAELESLSFFWCKFEVQGKLSVANSTNPSASPVLGQRKSTHSSEITARALLAN